MSMNTVTIIPSQNCVLIDGEPGAVNCSTVDPTIHAIQWSETKARGFIEFVDEDITDSFKEPNQNIDSIAPWQPLIDQAVAAIADAKAKQAAMMEEMKRAASSAEATRTR
jgi:hypothetical protein